MNKIIVGIVVLLLVVTGIYMLGTKTNKQPLNTDIVNPTASPQPSVSSSPQASKEETVAVTSSGFSPSTLTIKAGTKVVWINKSGGTATVNSNFHPTHLLYPPLNLGEFADGSSVSLVFNKTGKFTYHNHLNPNQTGTIIVE